MKYLPGIGIGLLVLLNLLALSPNVVAQGSDCEFIETFETDTIGQNPLDCWYVESGSESGNTVIANPNPEITELGNNVYRLQGTQPDGLNMGQTTGDFCDTPTGIKFSFKGGFPTSTGRGWVGMSPSRGSTASGFLGISMDLNGLAGPSIIGDGQPPTTVVGSFTPTLTINGTRWYEATMIGFSCHGANAITSVSVRDLFDNTTYTGSISGADDIPNTVSILTLAKSGSSNNPSGYFDNIELIGVYPAIAASATFAGTGIVGFDNDDAGDFVYVRTNSGDFVRSLNATTLTQVYSQDTNCGITNGVVAGSQGFGFFNCAASVPNTLVFLKEDGTKFLTGCAGTCPDVIFNLVGITDETDFNDMVWMTGANYLQEQEAGDTIYEFGLFVSATDGKVYGLNAAMIETGDEAVAYDSLLYANDLPNGICTVYGNIGEITNYATDSAFATRGYTLQTFNVNEDEEVFVDLVHTFSGQSAYNQMSDLDCSTEGTTRLISNRADRVVLVLPTQNTVLWTITGISPLQVAISNDGEFAAYATSTITYIVEVDTGEIIAQANNPAGTLLDIGMDNSGGALWIATSTNVAYYDISPETCGESCDNAENSSGTSSTSGTTTGGGGFGGGGNTGTCESNFMGINIGYVANAWNTTETPIRWLLGILLTVLVIYGFAKIGSSAVLMGVAILIGVGGAVAFCLFPVWLLLVIILIVALAIGNLFFGEGED